MTDKNTTHAIRTPSHWPTPVQMNIDALASTDERTTVVYIRNVSPGQPILDLGRGVATRRKTDKRDFLLGVQLAFARALEAAAHTVRIELLAGGHEDLCGLPKADVEAWKEEHKKMLQEYNRATREMVAAMSGGHTPHDVGLDRD